MCSYWKLHLLNVVKSGVITGIGDYSASLPLVLQINFFRASRCKPKKCRQECKKSCPVVKIGEHYLQSALDSGRVLDHLNGTL